MKHETKSVVKHLINVFLEATDNEREKMIVEVRQMQESALNQNFLEGSKIFLRIYG